MADLIGFFMFGSR